jgi:ATP-dependent Clp protease ATP-binding subunit ClpC
MFERFTDRARRVIVLAQEEARMLNHNYIGTEHLLLGLLHEGQGLATQVLESLGIGLEAVREQVEEAVGRGQQAVPERTPFTPQAKKVLELARREAFQLGHHYIGTEHILLGLIREGDGTGARVLAGLGADLHLTRQQVPREPVTAACRRPHSGLSPAPHKIDADAGIIYQCRSGRVRRQGLEPRTRGLRVRCSAN